MGQHRAVGSLKCYNSLPKELSCLCRALLRDDRALLRDDRALLRDDRALLRDDRALLRDDRALLQDNRALLRYGQHRAVGSLKCYDSLPKELSFCRDYFLQLSPVYVCRALLHMKSRNLESLLQPRELTARFSGQKGSL